MYLEVYDGITLNRVDVIKTYTFVQYTDYFNDVGTFSVKVPVTETSLRYLRIRGNMILFEKLGRKLIMGIIDYVHKQGIASATVEIKGYLLPVLLSYRVIMRTFRLNGSVFEIQRYLIGTHFIEPTDQRRKVNEMKLDSTFPASSAQVNYCKTGDDVLKAIIDLNDTYNYGFSLTPEIAKYDSQHDTPQNITGFIFEQHIPVDRSVGNAGGVDPVIFDMNLFNLEDIDYEIDCTKLKSIAIVAGEDKGENRKIVEVGDETLSDRNRIELYVDARDIQKEIAQEDQAQTGTIETDENGEQYIVLDDPPKEELSDEEYEEMLHERGLEKLRENLGFDTFNATVHADSNNTFVYGVDYNNGDTVTVYDRQIQAKIDIQIKGVTRSLTEQGEVTDLIFSDKNYKVTMM